MDRKSAILFVFLAAVLLFDFVSSKQGHRKLRKTTVSPEVKSCNGVDDCWTLLFDELSSGRFGECRAWKQYGRCLRKFADYCKDDFYYMTQVESVRLRIQQLSCSRSTQHHNSETAIVPLVVDNAQPIAFRPLDTSRHLRSHKQPDTSVCQTFGYGHTRTFSGDIVTCTGQQQNWASTLFEVDDLFSVRANYQQQPGLAFSQLHHVSVSYFVRGSRHEFTLVPSTEPEREIVVVTGEGTSIEYDVDINYDSSNDDFSVVDVTVLNTDLRFRVRRRRLDDFLHSVTLQTNHYQMDSSNSRKSSSVCVSGCSFDGLQAKKVDLALEIARHAWHQHEIRSARSACAAALIVENEYLSPCVFDHLASSEPSAPSLCKDTTPQCAKLAADDMTQLAGAVISSYKQLVPRSRSFTFKDVDSFAIRSTQSKKLFASVIALISLLRLLF